MNEHARGFTAQGTASPFLPIRAPAGFRIIAHRGASAYAPENTLPAFELARAMSVTEVEVDAQLSTDGVVVLCHDDTLQRYGHGGTKVEALSCAELVSLDMGSWFSPYHFAHTPMLTLDELVASFADDFVFHIELKGAAPDLAAAVHSVVKGRGLLDRSIFTSFSFPQLRRLRATSTTVRLGWLVENVDERVLEQAADLALFQLCPKATGVSAAMVRQARDVVPEVRAWGLNGLPQEVRRLVANTIESGCDGMTINWPDWVTHSGPGSE